METGSAVTDTNSSQHTTHGTLNILFTYYLLTYDILVQFHFFNRIKPKLFHSILLERLSTVWHFLYCSLVDQMLFTKPFFLCQYWKLNYLFSNFAMELLEDPSLVLYTIHLIHLSVLLGLYLIQQQTITSMLMMLNFGYHSQLRISFITSLTLKIL